MKKRSIQLFLPAALMAMAFLVTGCPHNDYTVQLKPQGQSMERTLIFYRVDGTNDQTFDADELAMITAQYPTNGVVPEGKRFTAQGSFGNRMPDDVGGMGVYTNWSNSLGNAGFYMERFRGSDDLAGMAEKRSKAADQLADILVGWSRAELGREPGYNQLHQFLDVDFRHDLKNASDYWWQGQTINGYETNADEEFTVRFGQYLLERGYFKLDEIPGLIQDFDAGDAKAAPRWIQRLVARKMGIADASPVPASLAFLTNDVALNKSFTNYEVHTDIYRAKLKQWEKDKKANPEAKELEPGPVLPDTVAQLLGMDFDSIGGTADHLTVQLSLPAPPLHSNGHWDETAKLEVWNSDLEGRTNLNHLPFSCYASWAQADEDFQKAHLGKVALTGDDLAHYCLWRGAQGAQAGGEWDAFLASLQPDSGLVAKLDAFRFTGEAEGTNNQSNIPAPSSTYPRELLKKALQ